MIKQEKIDKLTAILKVLVDLNLEKIESRDREVTDLLDEADNSLIEAYSKIEEVLVILESREEESDGE